MLLRDGRAVLAVAEILLVASALRGGITAVGPLVADLRAALGLSNAAVGLVTTLPLVAFAVISPLAAPMARRLGIARVLMGAMALLTAGLLLRSAGSLWALYAGTVLVGAGIAAGNVLLPAAVRRAFPDGGGPMTGAYVTVMVGVAGVAAAVAVPLADAGLGWQGALACWAVLSALAVLAWIPGLRRPEREAPAATPQPSSRPWRSRLAWAVTLYMGLQSFVFYALVAWMPEMLRADGMDEGTAGLMLGLVQVASLATTMGTPVLAGRARDQNALLAAGCVTTIAGFGGLLAFGADLAAVWAVLLGLGTGATFGLALMLFILRTRDEAATAALSGMAQAVGYAIAAAAPAALGALHDATGSWAAPLAVCIAVSLLSWGAGAPASRDRIVT